MLTPVTTPGDHYFHYIFYNIYLAFSFLCHLHHLIVMNRRLYFKMVENPVFDLKIKHFPSVHGCGDKQFCGTWNSI